MATKILESTIHCAIGHKIRNLIRPKITVWKCYGNSRKRVHKTRAGAFFGPPIWRDTVRVELPTPTCDDATLVFQLTDIFHRKIARATVPMINITEGKGIYCPLVSREGQTIGILFLDLRLIDHIEDQSTTTNEKATSKLDVANEICSALDET